MTWSNSGGRSVPYALQQACFKRDHWTCQGCGYEGRQRKGDLHADHIRNRAEGGEDALDNLQTLCDDVCHAAKTARERARGMARRSGRRRPRVHPADALGR